MRNPKVAYFAAGHGRAGACIDGRASGGETVGPMRDFLLERYYARHEFTTRHALSASDCEPRTLAELLARTGAPAEALLRHPLGYTETRGAPALRAAIARHYPGCTAEDVLVCNAPEEAIYLAMHVLLAPGERVIVQTPCYQSLKEIARGIGCEVLEWPLVEGERGWRLDLARLDALLERGPRLLVTNAPHNPTGFQPGAGEWRALGERVRARGLRWFSDEMYRGLEPEPGLALEPAAAAVPGALSLWGMSKSFGLAGLRIGWLVTHDAELLARIEALKDYTSICSNALGELAAELALDAAEPILAENRARIADNARRMADFAARHAERLTWLPPMAGPVGLARLHSEPATRHAERVRLDGDALLVPSPLFDLEDRFVRVGLGRASFPQALAGWERARP